MAFTRLRIDSMKNDDIYALAGKKVRAKKGFLYHLLAYVLILTMLSAIMYYENDGKMLPVIIVGLSWGIGVAAHYLSTFGTDNLEFLGVSSDWEEEELEKELARLVHKRQLMEEIERERDLLRRSEQLDLREMDKRPLDTRDLL